MANLTSGDFFQVQLNRRTQRFRNAVTAVDLPDNLIRIEKKDIRFSQFPCFPASGSQLHGDKADSSQSSS
ncbi:MAG: hypothetical protein DIKNOCCD_01955 [bacterium]|nr:hypothetical protein [bacterium]